jgi:hypothetical protein
VPDPPPVVFAHLVREAEPGDYGTVVDARDGPPSSGEWHEHGHVRSIFDRHVLVVPADASPGRYQVRVGLYDPETLDRLPVEGRDAFLPEALPSVTVGDVEVR